MAETDELPVPPDYRALALLSLGIAELWAGRPRDARQHLDDALDRARRISRPFIEVGCLAHLAIAAPLTGQPLPLALGSSERAIAIAEEHGWTDESMTSRRVRDGRHGAGADGSRRRTPSIISLAGPSRCAWQPTRGQRSCSTTPAAWCASREGRFDEALAEFARAEGLERLLAGEHVFTVDARALGLQARVRSGDAESAAAELAGMSAEERNRAGMRIALAAIELDQDDPEQAVGALMPVIDGSAPALYDRWARVEALLLDATARDRLGDRRATEDSLEAALELAEPEGLILPFMLWPNRELLERHPRHRTAHATLISTILDTLAGRAGGEPAAPLRDELSHAELRVVRYLPSNLTAAQIASELIVSPNTVRTHMRHIYAKLDAHTRSEAVARARELGLLAPGGPGR